MMAALPEKSQHTVEAIYRYYEVNQETGYRYHLGASLIGTECERSLWLSFRWATKAKFAGRMLRLFETGQLEEARFVANLRSVGIEVYEFEYEPWSLENMYLPAKQIGVRDAFGHFGGSLDGMAIGFVEAPKTWHVCEFKTHSEKSFEKLKKDKVKKSKPRHYAQIQVYMHLLGIERAFYMAKNKNTDELYQERVEYDATFAIQLLAKANRVIQAPRPPAKISHDPAWFECRYCDHHDVCHGEAKPERHCRSCMHSTPVEGGTWLCQQAHDAGYDGEIPREVQEKGCDGHRYIPDLVHGTQVDATEATPGNWLITYHLKNGNSWVDGFDYSKSSTEEVADIGDSESGLDADYEETGAPF